MTISTQFVDRQSWQRLAPSFVEFNCRHLWDFGVACAERVGAASEHVAVYDDDELIGLADVRVKRIPFFRTGIAYINGGPLVCREMDSTESLLRLRTVLDELVNKYVRHNKFVLRICPPIGNPSWNDEQASLFIDIGFNTAISLKPYRTFLLDLAPSLEDLRKGLDQKWRNNLKRSEKVDLFITTEKDISSFDQFEELYKPFIQKKKFKVDLTPSFYRKIQGHLAENEKFQVLLCYYEGECIAGHISSQLGNTAVNLFRANSEVALQLRAAYRLQWEGVRYAKEAGLKWYDLGGIDPDNNPGVYAFKKGMGGIDTTAPGPFEYYPGRLKKTLIFRGEQMYRYLKRFMKR